MVLIGLVHGIFSPSSLVRFGDYLLTRGYDIHQIGYNSLLPFPARVAQVYAQMTEHADFYVGHSMGGMILSAIADFTGVDQKRFLAVNSPVITSKILTAQDFTDPAFGLFTYTAMYTYVGQGGHSVSGTSTFQFLEKVIQEHIGG